MSQRYLGGIITANPTAPTLASASGVWTQEQYLQYIQPVQPKVIPKSVRLRSSASAYFSRTPASATNRRTWTWSGWIKRGTLSATQRLLNAYSVDENNTTEVGFDATNNIIFSNVIAGSQATGFYAQTSAVFRDPSAWYHIVFSVDTTQSTAAAALKVYVNGVQQTFGTSSYGGGANQNTWINAALPHRIGQTAPPNNAFFDGYLAELYFIDGQALTPSSFGAFDSYGVWQPLGYTGTYGTNGFYLNFSDTTSTTTLGYDTSGNGNNWTANNISLTAGVTYDSMLDSPINFDNGGTGVGNYAVLNPIGVPFANGTVTDGNLKFVGLTTTDKGVAATISIASGTFYWESTQLSNSGSGNTYAGVILTGASSDVNANRVNVRGDGVVYKYGTSLGVVFPTFTNNDIIGLAYDRANNTLALYKNGTLGYTVTGLNSADHTPWVGGYTTTDSWAVNFGQRPFSYTPPTGFKALNTQNLAISAPPTINNGALYMAASLYTGNGGTAQSIANSANNTIGTTFLPDFVWIKARNSAAYNHRLYDSVRGVGKEIYSSSTAAEATVAQSLTSFNSNGFTIGTDLNNNNSGTTYVGWQWKASGTTLSNTNGSITSTVSVNATAGFSVVTFTAPASGNFTVGHGLGVTPAMMILKDRSAVVSWAVWHQSLSNPAQSYLALSNINAAGANTTVWGNTAPTSTVMTLGVGGAMNANDATVAYCWSEIKGYSAFGSYTGNGSTDGPFVYCGFRPRFIMFKMTSSTSHWVIVDTSRSTYNETTVGLEPDSSGAETTGIGNYDILSNGFKCRNSVANEANVNGGTYIYAAFAENPFTIARAR